MAKTASKSKTAYLSQYKSTSRWASNRKRKLERQLKLQPNNAEQIKRAIGNISYRRKTPTTAMWSHGNIRIATVFKQFSGRAPLDLFSSNPKTQAAALQYYDPKREFFNMPEGKVSFSLAARAHDKQGKLVWA